MLHAALVLADYAGTMDVSDRFEVRGRITQPALANAPPVGLDLADIATVRFGLSDRSWKHTLGYSATGLLAEAEALGAKTGTGAAPQLLQSADIGTTWHDRRVQLGLAEYGTYGLTNSGFLLTGPTPVVNATQPPAAGVQALAAPQNLTFGSSRTVLTGRYQLAPRWLGTTSIEYALQGGVDSSSQLVMPVVRGPRAEAILGYNATRIDVVETRATGQRADTSSGPCSPIITRQIPNEPCQPTSQSVELAEVWRHRFTRDTEGLLGAGASFDQVTLGGNQPYANQVSPVALVGIQYTRTIQEVKSIVRLDLTLAPFLDYRTGVIDERAQATLVADVHARPLTFQALAGAVRSIASPLVQPVTILQAGVQADWELTRVVSVGGGVRYAWQQQDPLGVFAGELVFVALTLRAPEVRF